MPEREAAAPTEFQLPDRVREMVERIRKELIEPASLALAQLTAKREKNIRAAAAKRDADVQAARQVLAEVESRVNATITRLRTEAAQTTTRLKTEAAETVARLKTEAVQAASSIDAASGELESTSAAADRFLSAQHVQRSTPPPRDMAERPVPGPPYSPVPVPSDDIESLRKEVQALERSKRPLYWPKSDAGRWSVGILTVVLLFIFAPLVVAWPVIVYFMRLSWASDTRDKHGRIVARTAVLQAYLVALRRTVSAHVETATRTAESSMAAASRAATAHVESEARTAESNLLKPARAKCEETSRAAEERCKRAADSFSAGLRGEAHRLQERMRAPAASLHADAERLWRQCGYAGAEWDADVWRTWEPDLSPEFAARIGTLRLDTRDLHAALPALNLDFALPALVPFVTGKCLLLNAAGTTLGPAAEALASVVLRALANTPPAKARFLFIDPVGLGHNVTDFMALGDYAPELVGGKAWTESRQINEQLLELTEHMETVIQKYLRKEFASILDYNERAQEVAEPFRFLVVFDFPAKFTEESAQRLVSAVRQGPRCGVFTFVLRDTSKPLPHGFAIQDLEQSAHVIQWAPDAKAGGSAMPRWMDPVVGPGTILQTDSIRRHQEVVKTIISRSGERATAAMKVEVPFDKLLTTASLTRDRWWLASAASSVRIPLGPSGARRLQEMVLGEGLAHHGLIVGRTGSGKTNLMHVIISTLALTYSPDELELYLVDFKGGVGFKPYATHQLPQAAVIAIESEREFGISVLRRLDAELRRRFEVFRSAGVDTLSDYRSRGGSSSPMPRVLLIVDEYQEFFSHEDASAQEARGILDRIVRQGRSFGIHILLGTQSLSGTAQLSTSTMGQMAVRIALPCNESDARLVFADDNTAARSLARPGEAIYNSTAGLVEGNSPFQVAMLGDSDLQLNLEALGNLAQAKGRTRTPLIFEGNEPASLETQGPLTALMSQRRWNAGVFGCTWLGEPVAILPPVETVFTRQSGRHLLIVSRDEGQAVALLQSAWLGLLCHHRPTTARFYVLDLATAEAPWASHAGACRSLFDHQIEMLTRRSLPEVLTALLNEIRTRLDSHAAPSALPPIYLIIQGLQRARDLRVGEDSFYSTPGKPQTPAQLFAQLLREGPEVGVHVIAWCDTVADARRSADRALAEFGMKVAGPMSVDDSSVLLDCSDAGRLNKPHRLLFADEEKPGLIQKFRPYALPRMEWVEALARQQREWKS